MSTYEGCTASKMLHIFYECQKDSLTATKTLKSNEKYRNLPKILALPSGTSFFAKKGKHDLLTNAINLAIFKAIRVLKPTISTRKHFTLQAREENFKKQRPANRVRGTSGKKAHRSPFFFSATAGSQGNILPHSERSRYEEHDLQWLSRTRRRWSFTLGRPSKYIKIYIGCKHGHGSCYRLCFMWSHLMVEV